MSCDGLGPTISQEFTGGGESGGGSRAQRDKEFFPAGGNFWRAVLSVSSGRSWAMVPVRRAHPCDRDNDQEEPRRRGVEGDSEILPEASGGLKRFRRGRSFAVKGILRAK